MSNSVKWINTKVQEIVELARDYMGRLNVQASCDDLLANNYILQEYFKQDVYDTDELYRKEEVVCTNYVRLEYILCPFVEVCKESYVRRNMVKKSYEKLIQIAKCEDKTPEIRLEALSLVKTITNAYLSLNKIDIGVNEQALVRCGSFIKENEVDDV